MDVREAINQAKTFLQKLYADEDVSQVRLEEVEFDEPADAWLITLGIMRPAGSTLAVRFASAPLKRTYKIIKVPDNGHGWPSMKIRDFGIPDE